MIDRYAVVGHPIAHSKSPAIHSQYAKQTKQQLEYSAIDIEPGNFINDVKTFFDNNGFGLNVTVPYKEEAFNLADQLSPRAQSAGAVNTLKLMADGSIFGDNTDGGGLVKDITVNASQSMQNKRILILGAGGASKGVLLPILEQQPEQIVIANRTAEKAIALAQKFDQKVTGIGLNDLGKIEQPFDIIINATSASLSGQQIDLPTSLLSKECFCYDMMYANELTVFLKWAELHGAKTMDGLGMLVEQAALSFELWREKSPATHIVLEQLRAQLA